MQVLQVLQARHLFACSLSSDSNRIEVIKLLATKSLHEDSLYSTAVVDTYDILSPLHYNFILLPFLEMSNSPSGQTRSGRQRNPAGLPAPKKLLQLTW